MFSVVVPEYFHSCHGILISYSVTKLQSLAITYIHDKIVLISAKSSQIFVGGSQNILQSSFFFCLAASERGALDSEGFPAVNFVVDGLFNEEF